MFSQTVRYLAYSIIGVAGLFLVLGVLLFQAASATGADSDYGVHVSWFLALSSGIRHFGWPSLALLFGAFLLAVLTSLIFFRVPRGIGAAVLFLQAAIASCFGGQVGWFFFRREFGAYHFSMDAEKLGEYWFFCEAIAVWMLAAATLGVIRVFARKETR